MITNQALHDAARGTDHAASNSIDPPTAASDLAPGAGDTVPAAAGVGDTPPGEFAEQWTSDHSHPADTTGQALAVALTYPDACFAQRLDETIAYVQTTAPEAATLLTRFRAATETLSPEGREELYTRTFDINPTCSLEIGWHLFGEDYYRGAMLVRLRAELRRHGMQESSELPDHLEYVLPLLDRMAPDEAQAFADACVIPALDKMLIAFEGSDNPYGDAMMAVAMFLKQRFVPARAGDQ